MVFDLAINVNAFPKCNKCNNEMVLVKAIETETIMTEMPDEHRSSFHAPQQKKTEKAQNAADTVVFTWKCSCGNIIEEKM
ncbi:MAG: hypothetical protein V1870_00120 [Candidatus Aenigmatarchaeota archaeon]